MSDQTNDLAASVSEAEPSLFGEILDWMLAPLLFVWPLSIVFTHYFANTVANYPYDQILKEQVIEITRQIQLQNTSSLSNAPIEAKKPLQDTESNNTFFHVLAEDGSLLAGDQDLPLPEQYLKKSFKPGELYVRDTEFKGKELRFVFTFIPWQRNSKESWLLVQLAETTEKREQLANKIIANVILPQFIIIPLAVALVWFGLSKGLRPLRRLYQTIEARNPSDFSPICTRRIPEELTPLVESFNQMLERMKKNVEIQQRFIADAAHQMRTPLTGLKTQAQSAIREKNPDQLQQALQQIRLGVDRAAHLVNQLLTLARAEGAGDPANQNHLPTDLSKLLRESLEDLAMIAIGKNIDIGYESRGAAMILGNTFLLRELIKNLIDNALHYTPHGGHVTCRILAGPENIVLEIEDDGIGITEEAAKHVFERFFRAENVTTEGSGLGLAIVQEIAQLHNAQAKLRPNPKGQGCIAQVIFPTYHPSDEELPSS